MDERECKDDAGVHGEASPYTPGSKRARAAVRSAHGFAGTAGNAYVDQMTTLPQ